MCFAFSDGRIVSGGIAFNAEKMHLYEEIQRGNDPALIAEKERQQRLANLFFAAAGVEFGSRIFDGCGSNGEVAVWLETEDPEETISIPNPYFTGGIGRLASFTSAPANDGQLFRCSEKNVEIKKGMELAKKITAARCDNLYYDTAGVEKVW